MRFRFTKKLWMQIHTYLSLFFLPAAFIYVMTGGLFMFGINHHSTADTYEFKLDYNPKIDEVADVIIKTLQANNMKIPNDTTIRITRNTHSMGNVAYSASLAKDKDGNSVVRVVDRGLYSTLMMMHKSAGTKHDIFGFKLTMFDVIAVLFSISMLIFYLSGLIVTSFCKKNRKTALAYFGAGLLVTAFAIWGSL